MSQRELPREDRAGDDRTVAGDWPRVGVLALQGGFAAHVAMLSRLGVVSSEVRTPDELPGLAGLVLPGGESTTLLHLMRDSMFAAVQEFAASGGALFGTCAGAILMATTVVPDQESLAVLEVSVERNAYGRQLGSFEARLQSEGADLGCVDGVFIRAPRFTAVGEGVRVLARHHGDPVLIQQGRHLAATFHPELTDSTSVHQRFVDGLIREASGGAEAGQESSSASCS